MFCPRQIRNHDHDLRRQMTAPQMKISTENQFIHVETPGLNGLKPDPHLSSRLCSHFKNMHECFVMPLNMLLECTLLCLSVYHSQPIQFLLTATYSRSGAREFWSLSQQRQVTGKHLGEKTHTHTRAHSRACFCVGGN